MPAQTRASIGHVNSSGTEPANFRARKPRRSHRKSRNGCIECKNRHIRCDERQPLCSNCQAAERTCFFPPPKAVKQKQKQGQARHVALTPSSEAGSHSNDSNIGSVNADAEHTHMSAPALRQRSNPSEPSPMQPVDVHTPPADCVPGLSTVPDAVTNAIFTPQHLILLRHADMVPNFTIPNRSVVDIAIRRAVDSPYFIDEVLAFTAFHLAYLYPGSATCLRDIATELQNRALTSFTRFTEMVPIDDEATVVPRFLFSAILGWHALADTLAHHRCDFHVFIDRFVECLNLNRGVRAVIPPVRDYLYISELQPFLKTTLEAEKKITSPGSECDPLSRLMDESDLSEASAKACRQAIAVLQRSFDLCRSLGEGDYPQPVSAFSVGVEVGFVDALRKHRPEALIILAFYGVLLHRFRSFWPFGCAGAFIIRAIAGHVGSYWQKALAWPLHVLETELSPEPVNETLRNDIPSVSLRTPH